MKITPLGILLCALFLPHSAVAGTFLGGKPPPDAIHVGQFTPGGCIEVCKDLGYCDDARINEVNGPCWLVVDRGDPAFLDVQKTCPHDKPRPFKAVRKDGQWALRCE